MFRRVKDFVLSLVNRDTVLFTVTVLSLVTTVQFAFLSNAEASWFPAFFVSIVATVNAICLIVYGLVLFSLFWLNHRFRPAAVFVFLRAVICFLMSAGVRTFGTASVFLCFLPDTIICFISNLLEFSAYEDISCHKDAALSGLWRKLRKWMVILPVIMLVSLIAAFLLREIALLIIFAGYFGLRVVNAFKTVLLFRTAVVFKQKQD